VSKFRFGVELCGLKLKNPLILASGILGVTAATMIKVGSAGAAAVVTKSIGLDPRPGHKNPCLIEVHEGLLNAMGLPNPGIDEFGSELERLKGGKLPVIGSIFGGDAGEFRKLAEKMESFGAAAVELNLSCPHAKGLGLEVGSDPKMVKKVVKAVTGAVDIPVFAKLTAHTPRIVELGMAACDGGADGLVAINTIRAMKIDTVTATPVLGNRIGGLSGPVILPIGVRAVYELCSELDITVVGCGGVSRGTDVIEYMMAGASAVQIGSAAYYRGMDVFKKIEKELVQYMSEQNIKDINDIVGVAHKRCEG